MMQLRLMDEVMDLGPHGVALLCAEEEADGLQSGMRIVDARGHEHKVSAVSIQEGICTLHLPMGEAAYFERLFRDVRVDATLFTIVEETPCP